MVLNDETLNKRLPRVALQLPSHIVCHYVCMNTHACKHTPTHTLTHVRSHQHFLPSGEGDTVNGSDKESITDLSASLTLNKKRKMGPLLASKSFTHSTHLRS